MYVHSNGFCDMTKRTIYTVAANLVPRVSHLNAPGASEERPWFGLVTCYYDN